MARTRTRREDKRWAANVRTGIVLVVSVLVFVLAMVRAQPVWALTQEDILFDGLTRMFLAVSVILLVAFAAELWYRNRCDSYYERQRQRAYEQWSRNRRDSYYERQRYRA